MRRQTIAGFAILAALAASPARAQTRDPVSAEDVKCGVFAPAGIVDGLSSDQPRLARETKELPARTGVTFGMIYTLKRFLGTGEAPVTVVFVYPEAGLKNPGTGKISSRDEIMTRQKLGRTLAQSYTIANDWQIVPGAWLVQIFDQKKKLAECSFTMSQRKAGKP